MIKRIAIIIWSVMLFLLIFLYPAAAITSAKNALSAWATTVLPSLMPFSIATGLLSICGIVDLIASLAQNISKRIFGFSGEFIYAFLASALSGYLIGAKVTSALYKNGKLTREEASAMINCTSTSGPMFIIGAVSIGMLSNRNLAPYLLYAHYFSAILLAVFVGRKFRNRQYPKTSGAFQKFIQENPLRSESFANLFSPIIYGTIETMLSICGFMMIYSVFTGCAEQALTNVFMVKSGGIVTMILGLFEMTIGCINSVFLPLQMRIVFMSGLISFGGFCIHSQTQAIAAKNGIPLNSYSLHKSIQGILSALITFILTTLFPLDTKVFNYSNIHTGIPAAIFLFLCAILCVAAALCFRHKRHIE